ncbi:SAP domain-containing protein [Staphylococcus succinus]|uniref:SAP domain-containing protein n=1 Tax=Staphylococcus succinus TaxID=61015 RepID=UPI000E6A93FA|nr:SAP domain-containing protein [Staphylococcus succinus]RIN27739.1 DNA-binding protein [Staphylococcus succinus]
MNINSHDLVTLHKNVNREVGKEIFWDGLFANNDIEIMNSLEKLIKENILIKTDQFDISIHKKKVTELKEVLKDSNFKTTGNKQVLINRISENFDSIGNLDLPYVYVTTKKGEGILKDTKYLLSFISNSTSVARAYYLAENYIDKNCEDKVAEIYKFEFQRNYENGDFKINSMYSYELTSLIWHYEHETQDYDNARKYLNIFLYFNFKNFLDDLTNSRYPYYDDKGNLILDKIQDKLINMISSHYDRIFERLILIEKLSNETMFEMFKNDTQKYNDLEDELIENLINYIVFVVKKENDTNTFMKLVETLKNGYTLNKDEFEDEYDYYSNFITTNISTLKDMDSQLEVEIDIRNGKINFFLDDDSLGELIKVSNISTNEL